MMAKSGEVPEPAGGWEPAGDAVVRDLRWSVSPWQAVIWDRGAPGAFLNSTESVHLGDAR